MSIIDNYIDLETKEFENESENNRYTALFFVNNNNSSFYP